MTTQKDQPVVLVIAGPNGAGKSTCAEGILGDALKLFHFVNADTIARGLSAHQPEAVAVQAGRLMLERLRELGRQRANFAFETTLAGRSHARLLADLKQLGYWVDLLYVSLPRPQLCVERVAKRVLQGGHAVPEADIRRRFGRSIENLFNLYMPLANRWRIFDNSENDPRLVARGGYNRDVSVVIESIYNDLKDRVR